MNALVSDFDGTITRNDFFMLLWQRYVPPAAPDYFAQYRAGRRSHFDAMAAYFSHAPTDSSVLDALLRATEPDPGFKSGAERLASAGWDLIIVSAGSSWYIQRILDAAGVSATVHSNPGRIVEGHGLVIEKPIGSPFYSDEVGIDKCAVVRDALSRYDHVAFAGDGPPDIDPALLVRADLRYARSFLAEELERRGEPYQKFGTWSEIVSCLLDSIGPL